MIVFCVSHRYEKNRLISFLDANWWAPVDPGDLAKFGFYWTGIADVGRCTFCRLEVRGWEPSKLLSNCKLVFFREHQQQNNA
jgi:hypothetical protein